MDYKYDQNTNDDVASKISSKSYILSFILTLLAYIVTLYLTITVIGLLFSLFLNADSHKLVIQNTARQHHTIVNILLLSPLIETLIVLLIWAGIARLIPQSLRVRSILFLLVLVTVAWMTHGGNVNAVFPATMFLWVGVFLLRSHRAGTGWGVMFIGAYLIHAAYNVPAALLAR